jgi:methionyl aminopeptidase
MSIESEQDLRALKKIGRTVALTLEEMKRHARPGVTTRELDEIGAASFAKYGARSAPQLAYDFPGATCISVNDEAAHGIPGSRVILAGDLVNIDVSAELDGYFADTGATVAVPPVSALHRKLCRCTRSALDSAIRVASAGEPINVVGRRVEREARRCGFKVIRELSGHGVGRHIHEEPRAVLNYCVPWNSEPLREGSVITIEPFLSVAAEQVKPDADGWTLRTLDGSAVAQYEHTIVVTSGQPIVITAI